MSFSGGIKKGDKVQVLTFIGEDFKDDRIGKVVNVDGAYILVKLHVSGVVCELYPNELKVLK